MQILEDTHSRLILSLTPWAQWIIPCFAGIVLALTGLFAPFEFPVWARAIFVGLGVMAPLAFLGNHAAVTAEFSRPRRNVKITRKKPIGGNSAQTIALADIEDVEEVVEVDVDNTSWHRMELILRPHSEAARYYGSLRISLTTGPVSHDQSAPTRRVKEWLGNRDETTSAPPRGGFGRRRAA